MMSRLTHWRLQFSVIKDLNKQFAQNEKSNSKNYVAWLLIAISIGMFLICSENIIPKNLLAKSIWSCELNLPLIEFRFHIWETEMCVCCELQKENTYMITCKRTCMHICTKMTKNCYIFPSKQHVLIMCWNWPDVRKCLIRNTPLGANDVNDRCIGQHWSKIDKNQSKN